jgi:hypothetical protein
MVDLLQPGMQMSPFGISTAIELGRMAPVKQARSVADQDFDH